MPLKKPLLTAVSSLVLLCGLAVLLPTLAFAQGQYTAGSIGVDVSYPNGSVTIPTTATFGIVGVTGGLTYSNNTYLAAEASHFTNLSFYANTGLNTSSTSPYYQQAVKDAAASGGVHSAAYYYGYNAGQAALTYATAQGENVKTTWWLDVETANTWNGDTVQHQQSLEGEYDALLAGGATTVGVYSTTYQWGVITGGWQNGWPSWGATALPTVTQALTYSTGHEFSGGPSYLMQYRPTGAKIDYDVACLPPTVVTSFTPLTGPANTQVTISGSGFTGATAVSFGGTAATFTVNSSATQITATVPAGATSGAIAVTTPAGTASSSASFTVVVQPPTLTAFTPTSGLIGSSVTLNGTNFTNATAVSFNGTAAIFTVVSATEITATVPSGASSGPLSVTTPGGAATSSTSFSVLTPVLKPALTLKLSGLVSGVLTLGKTVTASGNLTPIDLGGLVTLTVQREVNGKWLAVTAVTSPLSVSGTYNWTFKPTQAGTYRIKTTIAATSSHTAATTMWQAFAVRAAGVVKPALTLKLSGLVSGVLTLGKTVTASGNLTPIDLGGLVTLTVQREQSGKWLAVSSLTHAVTASGTYSATIKPASVATYRIKTTIAATSSHTAATTMWQAFAVSVVKPALTLKLSGLTSGVLRLGKVLTASGKVTPTNLGGKVTVTVQREQNGHWLAVTSALRTLSITGAYSWTYKPAERGSYRIKTTIARTTVHTAATTMWLGFAVK